MMFIVRTAGARPDDPAVRIAVVRRTPSIVRGSAGQTDLFCIGEETAAERLREQGWQIVMLRDGWYEDDIGGGVAIWGQGQFWEIRDTPFSVKEAAGPTAGAAPDGEAPDQEVDVRKGIFGT